MLLPLAAGLLASALLLVVSACASPEWPKRKEIWRATPEPPPGLQERLATSVALGAFGLTVGLPAALGFVDGNILVVLGGLAATSVARSLLLSNHQASPPAPQGTSKGTVDGDPGSAPDAAGESEASARWVESPGARWLWFAAFGWAIFAAGFSVGTFDLREGLAAQTVLGPAALVPGTWRAPLLALGFLAGVVAALFWLREAPPVPKALRAAGVGALLAWGEAALAGATLSASFFGPSVGALVAGPAAGARQMGTAASFLLTFVIVGALSASRRIRRLARPRLLPVLTAALALAAMGAAALGR